MSYFQPRFILNGGSYCSLDFEDYKSSTQKLHDAFTMTMPNDCDYEQVNHLNNSAWFEANLAYSASKQDKSVSNLL